MSNKNKKLGIKSKVIFRSVRLFKVYRVEYMLRTKNDFRRGPK